MNWITGLAEILGVCIPIISIFIIKCYPKLMIYFIIFTDLKMSIFLNYQYKTSLRYSSSKECIATRTYNYFLTGASIMSFLLTEFKLA